MTDVKAREFWIAEHIAGDEYTIEASAVPFTIIGEREVVTHVVEKSALTQAQNTIEEMAKAQLELLDHTTRLGKALESLRGDLHCPHCRNNMQAAQDALAMLEEA